MTSPGDDRFEATITGARTGPGGDGPRSPVAIARPARTQGSDPASFASDVTSGPAGGVLGGPRVKPRWRGVSHEIAFFVVLVVGPVLIIEASVPTARIAAAVYVVCLAGLFGVSALFHRVTWTPPARMRMRRLDHSMIFVFIAGTYTPIAGLTLERSHAIVMLSLVWAGALVGVAVKVFWIGAPKGLSAALYIGLGWLAILALPGLWSSLGPIGFGLLLAGGIVYTAGSIVFASRRPDPLPAVFGYHEIFHAFVIVAALCHFAVVAFWALPKAGT